jgi:hypothetical protein
MTRRVILESQQASEVRSRDFFPFQYVCAKSRALNAISFCVLP